MPIINQNEFRLGYYPSFDGIRGLFMIVVMIGHAQPTIIPGAKLVMSIFFALSGFLITAVLMKEWNKTGKINVSQFYLRRALRILPALFLLLLVCCLYALTQSKIDAIATYKSVAVTLLYVANWYIALDLGILGPLTHTWSLSVEEQFYIVLPLFLSFILWLKLKKKWIIVILILGIVIGVIHTISLWNGEESIKRIYYATDTRIDQFLVGCLFGLLALWNYLPTTYWSILISKIAAIISAIVLVYLQFTITETDPFMSMGGPTVTGIATSLLIINLITSPVKLLNNLLEMRFLVWAGQLSYGLYLWHFPIFRQITALNLDPILSFIIGTSLTFITAILSYYLIELPFLRLKKRSKIAPDNNEGARTQPVIN